MDSKKIASQNTPSQVDDVSYDKDVDNDTFAQDMDELAKNANSSLRSPGMRGDTSVSGSTPGVDSDDNVLEYAHEMGIAANADLENPKELNLAKDVHDAEEHRRTH